MKQREWATTYANADLVWVFDEFGNFSAIPPQPPLGDFSADDSGWELKAALVYGGSFIWYWQRDIIV
jgi:hypothetical protein